jgi:hypothetical protein
MSSRILIPGTPEFLIVRDAQKRSGQRTLICEVCRALGTMTVYYEEERAAFVRHINACWERHEGELRERTLEGKAPQLFDPQVAGDVELRRWVREHRAEILRGSKKM